MLSKLWKSQHGPALLSHLQLSLDSHFYNSANFIKILLEPCFDVSFFLNTKSGVVLPLYDSGYEYNSVVASKIQH